MGRSMETALGAEVKGNHEGKTTLHNDDRRGRAAIGSKRVGDSRRARVEHLPLGTIE